MSLTDMDLLCYRELAVSQTFWPNLGVAGCLLATHNVFGPESGSGRRNRSIGLLPG
jgi:hypothetical protein